MIRHKRRGMMGVDMATTTDTFILSGRVQRLASLIERRVRPNESIALVIASLGTEGGTIRLGDGTFHFYETLDVVADNINIICSSATVLEGVRLTSSMFNVTGTDFSLTGGTITEADSSAAAITVTGIAAAIDSVTFSDCWQAVELDGSSYSRVVNCDIIDNRYRATPGSEGVIFLTGTINRAVVAANIVRAESASQDIWAGDAVSKSALTGNSVNTLRYKTGVGTVTAGNTGTETAA